MKYSVEDLEKGVGKDNLQNIQIRLSGDDIKFVVTEYSVSLFIDENTADSLQFHISTIIQDRERRKESQNKAGQNIN
jgi:hypothetical protein